MVRAAIFSLLALLGAGTAAQSPDGTLPADAQTVTGDALKALVEGKTFNYVVPRTNATFRVQYNTSGYAFINGANGLNDSAAYRIDGAKICTEWKRIPASCVEMRVKGEVLFAERADGSWGTMTLR